MEFPGFDKWKCTNPDDAFLGPPPSEQFFCAGCGEEISGEFCDEDGHGLCRGCLWEQEAESAADRRADR